MKKSQLKLLSLIVLVTSLIVSGCSSSSKGKSGDGELSEAELTAQREGRFNGGSIPKAEGEGIFRDIHFDFDSAAVTSQGRADIEANATILRDYPRLKLVLEGHCDSRGTAEYNMALGSKRAQAVRQILVSLGVSSSLIETISYGEEVPLDVNEDENAWARNRRVHFSAYGDSGK